MIEKHPKQEVRGFTLVETLVAITILMIAVAGPLSIANKSYHAAIDSKNQAIAYNLAQEVMEYVKNMKDNSPETLLNTLSGTCNLNGCGIDIDGFTNGPSLFTCSPVSLCKLYYNDKGYTHSTASGKASPFTRKLTLSGNITSSEAIVNVSVTWSTGTLQNEVKLQEYMTSSTR